MSEGLEAMYFPAISIDGLGGGITISSKQSSSAKEFEKENAVRFTPSQLSSK
jgi:hypothetical protein